MRAHIHAHAHTHAHPYTHTPLHAHARRRHGLIRSRCAAFTLAVEAAASATTADALQRHAHAAQSAPCRLCTAYPARGGTRSCSWPRAAVGREARPALGGTSECCAVQRYSEHRSLQAGSGPASHHSVGDSQSRAGVATATGGTETKQQGACRCRCASVDRDPNTRAPGSRRGRPRAGYEPRVAVVHGRPRSCCELAVAVQQVLRALELDGLDLNAPPIQKPTTREMSFFPGLIFCSGAHTLFEPGSRGCSC